MEFVRIDRSALPEEEHEAAGSIEMNLMAMQSNAQEFRQCADLYLFAHTRKMAIQNIDRESIWDMIGLIKIAGRNGSVVAYSFSRLMEAINSTKAPTLWAKADMAQKRAATKLFAKEFPVINNVRQSAAHPGELTKNPAEHARHRLKGPLHHPAIQSGGGTYIEGQMHALDDRLNFGATFEGNFVEYELSMAKADVLDRVAQHYRETFSQLDATSAQMRAWMRESDERHRQDQMRRPPWWHNLIRP